MRRFLFLALIGLFVSGCEVPQYPKAPSVSSLPEELVKKLDNADCTFDLDSRRGSKVRCRHKPQLDLEEMVIFERWVRAKDNEIRYSNRPPVVFSLIGIKTRYPNDITPGRYHRRLYGDRSRSRAHQGGNWRCCR